MEFIEGESLAERIRLGALPAQEAAQIVLAILCEAPRTSCFLPRAPSFSTSESLSMFRCLWRKREQFRGHPLDARSDLFSVGVIFYEMLTGQAPFPGESFGEIAHSVLQGSVPALRLARHFRHGTHCASCAGARSQGSTGVGPLGPRPVAHRQVQGRLGGGIAVG